MHIIFPQYIFIANCSAKTPQMQLKYKKKHDDAERSLENFELDLILFLTLFKNKEKI
jgi:hypothetical protein